MKLEGKGIVKNMTLYNPKDYPPSYFLHMKGNIDSILEIKKSSITLITLMKAQSEPQH